MLCVLTTPVTLTLNSSPFEYPGASSGLCTISLSHLFTNASLSTLLSVYMLNSPLSILMSGIDTANLTPVCIKIMWCRYE